MRTHAKQRPHSWIVLCLLVGLFVGATTAFAAANQAMPGGLRCEYLVNPQGIDVLQPRLSWTTQADSRAWMQKAYRILVASSQEQLARDEGDLWDSGRVGADRSTHVTYAGKPLQSRLHCYWKVQVWDEDGSVSAWSQPASWSMGLLQPTDWLAQWIGFDAMPDPAPARRADLGGKGHTVVIDKALYGVKGDATRQVDMKKQLQAQVDAGNLLVTPTNELAGSDPAHGTKKVLEFAARVDDWRVTGVAQENGVWDLTTGQKAKQYLPSPYLRTEFEAPSPIKKAVLYATAQGVVELSLNGQRVSDEVFTPGWTDYRKRIYYRTYDVTGMLQPGTNALGAILGDGWFRGNISCIGQNQYGTTLRLKAQLHIDYENGKTATIASDPSWQASYGPIIESDMQAGEVYDARREIPGWNRAGYDDSGWAPVVTGSAIKPVLEAYPGVPIRPVQELPAVAVTEPLPGAYVFDLGQNFSGWIRLKVRGEAGDTIHMRFAEMLKDDGSAYTINLRSARAVDTYILKGGGEEVWEPRFTFHGFRYVQISGLRQKPTLDAVTGVVLYSDSPESGSFACSNPIVTRIYQNIVWGQRSNYLEVPTDCPQRDERLGWTGDTQVFIRTGCYNQDASAFFTKWMVDLLDTQSRHGLFGNQAPVFHGHGAAAWACAGIISPWTIYKMYGDTRIVSECYEAMTRYMEACGKDGLGGRKSHTWGDWLAPSGRPPKDLISAAYYAYTTSLMGEMATVLGEHEDADRYQKQFEDSQRHFQKTYVSADGKIASDLQTAYCMALQYDLVTDTLRPKVEAQLVRRIEQDKFHLSVGFLGMPILFPTLTEMGRSDLAYRILQKTTYPSWGYSINQGATTIWERWNSYSKDKGFGDVKMNSFNHYSLGACGEWFYRSMLGIESEGAGFKKIIMKPEFGEGITWTRGHYDSIHGRIASDWKWEGDRFTWKVSIPANTTATVYVPAKDAAAVSESGKPVSEAKGVTFVRMDTGRAVMTVGSGDYEFQATK